MVDITQDDEHDLLSIQPPPPSNQDVDDDDDAGNNDHHTDESRHHDLSHHHDVTLDDAHSRQNQAPDQDLDQNQNHLIHASLDIPAGPYSLSELPQEQESHLPLPSPPDHDRIENGTGSDRIQYVHLTPSSSSSSSPALNHPSGQLEQHHRQLSEFSSYQSPEPSSRSRQPSQRIAHHQSQQTHQSRQSAGPDALVPKRKYKARCKWSAQDKGTLVRELVRQKDMGNQLGSGFLSESWVSVANLLAGSEDKSGGDPKGPDECKSAFSRLKREFIKVRQLKRSFAQWNDEDQRPEAEPATIKTFLAAHPVYAPYITGWPFFNSMEHINMGVTTLDASIAKPLATNSINYSGAEMDKAEESDGESVTSDVSSSRLTERRKRTASNAELDLIDSTSTVGGISNHTAINPEGNSNANGKQLTGGPGSSKRRNTVAVEDGEVGKESPSIVRHRARELLWKDVKEEGWSLTEQDIINVLGRFDENVTYAETYADIPYFTLRLLYLQSIIFPKLI
ncbi:hypothetical protein [Phaffia rhodozyma]|uniref:Uncharacterized protein n=1 Tax=Phaffia rhodozyma TaxID=264483 RepID=A0A0F7SPK3_PHARH|nr:hypothetical protein [Phaffia rhodozyma]